MKKLLISVIGLGMSLAVSAETYDVSASYSAGAEYSGQLVFRVDEGKSASFSNEQVQNFAVVVSKKTESQVLVNFAFAGGAYKSEAEAVLDLDRPAELKFNDQTFTFLVKKHSS
jgi:hypothetical protein